MTPFSVSKDAAKEVSFLFLLLCFLFIGGDLVSVKLGGLTFKIVALLLLMVWVLDLLRMRGCLLLGREGKILATLFLAAATISIPNSIDVGRTLAYSAWMFFTFLVLVPVFFHFAYRFPANKVVQTWFWAYRLQAIGLACELVFRILAGNHDRPHLWFYEPSYAAIYFAGYVGASMYLATSGVNSARVDLLLSITVIALLGSATGLYALVLAAALNLIVSHRRKLLLTVFALSSATLFMVMYLLFSNTEVYKLLFGYLISAPNTISGISMAILERGGTRVVRLLWGWQAFLTHPWVGIGFGSDKLYTAVTPIPDSARLFFHPWDEPFGNPFVNPVIEASGTMGITGLAAMVVLIIVSIKLLSSTRKLKGSEVQPVISLLIGFFSIFLALQFEGTFLRFYVWSTLALALGAAARIRKKLGVGMVDPVQSAMIEQR